MRRFAGVAFTAVVLLALTAGAHAETRQAFLNAFKEVSVVSTSGRGQFRADIAADESSFEFELSSQDIQVTVTVAHIHVAQPDVADAIVIHFCGSGGKAACRVSPATLTGTITAADVVASANVGRVNSLIEATELQDVIALVRQRSTYVNVHSSLSPGGEVRGNIR